MKAIHFIILLTLISGCFVTACQKDIYPENGSVDITLDISYESEAYVGKLPLSDITLNLYTLKGKLVTTMKSDENGHVEFLDLAPNTYKVQVVKNYSAAEFNALTGLREDNEVAFSSAIKQIEVVKGSGETHWDLALITGNSNPSGLIIKQIYYAGSDANQGASFRDQFIEIYNNSDSIRYADSLYLAEAYGANTANATYVYQANSGQYDWSKSYGMPQGINANTDYVYAFLIIQLPGTGKDYPILPGESIVVASTAANHRSPYVGADGVAISVKDPSLTVDLSTADFEAYFAPYLGTTKPLASDIDNPNVPNVRVVNRANGVDMIMNQAGQRSWIIFRDEGMGSSDQWKGFMPPYADGRESLGTDYKQIPVANILDGVELQSATSTQYPKRFTAKLDAGAIAVAGGARSSNSVIRKTKEVVNGRRILQDSNNSSDDFVSMKANPKGFVE
ncbi:MULTISPECIES: DUF4876 domain-containing protein [unclassified Sphingobacterium]|uniref:DUF4876 domain-containing protein n=1 Tax=unclassified Sphingobacterium TaxID=2609468 RepID=UPI0025F1BCF5|nr:DUF4876 domain-containing protein [Sphingobacterium sp. UBA5670]